MKLYYASAFVGMLLLSNSASALLFECVDDDGMSLYSDRPCPASFIEQSSDFVADAPSEVDEQKQQLLLGSWLQIYQDGVKTPSIEAPTWHFSESSYLIQTGQDLSRSIDYKLTGPLIETDDVDLEILQIDEKFLLLDRVGMKFKFRRK